MTAKSLDDDYFVKNAISCWLHHFPEHKWTPIYKELVQKEFIEKPKPKPRAERRRKPGGNL